MEPSYDMHGLTPAQRGSMLERMTAAATEPAEHRFVQYVHAALDLLLEQSYAETFTDQRAA